MQWGIMILVIQTLNICFVLDDITVTADGTDTYHLVKAAGKYKYVFIYLSYVKLKNVHTFYLLFMGVLITDGQQEILPYKISFLSIQEIKSVFGCQIRSIRINYCFPSIDVVSYKKKKKDFLFRLYFILIQFYQKYKLQWGSFNCVECKTLFNKKFTIFSLLFLTFVENAREQQEYQLLILQEGTFFMRNF